jgi:hypothetical protein
MSKVDKSQKYGGNIKKFYLFVKQQVFLLRTILTKSTKNGKQKNIY